MMYLVCDVMVGGSRDCVVIQCVLCVLDLCRKKSVRILCCDIVKEGPSPETWCQEWDSGLTSYGYGETAGAGPHR